MTVNIEHVIISCNSGVAPASPAFARIKSSRVIYKHAQFCRALLGSCLRSYVFLLPKCVQVVACIYARALSDPPNEERLRASASLQRDLQGKPPYSL